MDFGSLLSIIGISFISFVGIALIGKLTGIDFLWNFIKGMFDSMVSLVGHWFLAAPQWFKLVVFVLLLAVILPLFKLIMFESNNFCYEGNVVESDLVSGTALNLLKNTDIEPERLKTVNGLVEGAVFLPVISNGPDFMSQTARYKGFDYINPLKPNSNKDIFYEFVICSNDNVVDGENFCYLETADEGCDVNELLSITYKYDHEKEDFAVFDLSKDASVNSTNVNWFSSWLQSVIGKDYSFSESCPTYVIGNFSEEYFTDVALNGVVRKVYNAKYYGVEDLKNVGADGVKGNKIKDIINVMLFNSELNYKYTNTSCYTTDAVSGIPISLNDYDFTTRKDWCFNNNVSDNNCVSVFVQEYGLIEGEFNNSAYISCVEKNSIEAPEDDLITLNCGDEDELKVRLFGLPVFEPWFILAIMLIVFLFNAGRLSDDYFRKR